MRPARTSYVLLGLGLGLVALLLLVLYRLEPVEEYRPRLLLQLSFAAGDGEQDLPTGAALTRPVLFGVDLRGNLYLAGKGLGGLLVFDPAGQSLRHRLALAGLEDRLREMAVGAPGDVYLVREGEAGLMSLRLAEEEGAGGVEARSGPQEAPALKEIQLPVPAAAGEAGGRTRVDEVVVADNGSVYAVTLGISHERYVKELWHVPRRGKPGRLLRLEVTEKGPATEGETADEPYASLAGTPQGDLWVDLPEPENRRHRLRRIDGAGRTTAGFTLPGEADPGFRLIGADQQGSLYVGTFLGSAAGRVIKYSDRGEEQWEVAVPAGEATRHVAVRVDAGGNLYVLRQQAGGVSVEKWEVDRRWQIRRSSNEE